MRTIDLETSDAALAALVDDAARGEATVITREGQPEAVVVNFDQWELLSKVHSFEAWLLASPIEPGDIPPRERAPRRDADL